jgi:hypothetical protein
MAETKVINLEVKDNSEKAAKGFKNLNKEIKNTESSVKDTEEASKELGSATDSVTGGMLGKFKGLYTSVQTVVRGMNFLKLAIIGTGLGALLIAIVSIKQAFTSSEEGQNKFAKLLGVIGAVVGNLLDLLSDLGEFLIDVFTNPVEYIKKFAQLIKENIVNRFNGLLELIPQLGKAVSALFKGNFSEAGKIATNAVAKVTLGVDDLTGKINAATEATKAFIEEQIREAKIAGQIADDRAKADKLERGLIVQRAKADRDIADLREKAINREKFTTKERIAFLEEAQRIEDAITIKEIKAAKLRRDAKIEENKLSKSNKEELKEEEELKAKVIELETRSLLASKTLTKGIQTLRAEDLADAKAKQEEKKKLIDEQAAKEKLANAESLKQAKEKAAKEIEIADKQYDLLQKLRNTDQEQEIYELAKSYDAKFELANGNFELEKELEIAQKEEIAAINQKYRQQEKAAQDIIDKAEEEANKKKLADDKAILDSKYKMTYDTINALMGLNDLFNAKNEKDARRQFKINKALSLAQASIQTFQAVTGALTAGGNPLKLATGAQFIEAGIAAAVGAANIAKIAGTQFEGGGSSGGGSGGGSTPNLSTPQSVQPNFNIVGDSGVNQLDALKSQPSKVYVVSGEVSSAQALDRNRQRNATL